MLKKIPLLAILLPFSFTSIDVFAEPENSKDTEHENTVAAPDKTASKISGSREQFFNQCYRNVPAIKAATSTQDYNQIPVNIDARTLSGSPEKLIYQNDVNLTQGDKFLAADKLTYFSEEKRAIAEGNVNFVSGDVTLNSETIEAKLNSEQNTLRQADYQFHGRGGRGNAERIYDNGQDLYELNSSTYSACPPGDNTWSLDSTTLYIDNENGMGSAYNAVLKVKDIPVFYLPYVTYPITDKRKTGLLLPSYSESKTNGTTIRQPLYINIAENMDATITPTYMSKRGTLVAAEYRYLFEIGSGKLQAEYLSDDDLRGTDRHLYHWDHSLSFSNNWAFNVDYSEVSDDYYFSDITTAYGTRSSNQLLQTGKISYREVNWNSELEVRDFQILGDTITTPHRVVPKLSFSAYQPLNWKSLQLDWYSEISQFEHASEKVYSGTRIHLQPKLSLPLYYNAMYINTELKYMVSFYQQSLPDVNKESWYNGLDENVSRYIPSFKINSGVNFERDFTMFDTEYRQTLVPQIQYLYVPYKDQSDIGIYDTTVMQQDYYSLLRDNRFSGYDRIADANQITLGISSSFLNPLGQEKIRFAIGQNYYFTPSRTQLPTESSSEDKASRSSIIGEFDINFANDYFFHAGLEWDNDSSQFKRANGAFEKRWSHDTYAQLNYRYIAASEDDNEGLVNQLGYKLNWPINSQWSTFASYYYDLEYKHPYESILGIKYQSCCWAISLTYDKHMLTYYDDLNIITENYKSERSYKINFELMGLGGVGFNSGEQGLFNYGRPFYLQ